VTVAQPLLRRALFSVLAGTLVVGVAACNPRRSASAPVAVQAVAPSSDYDQALFLLNGFRAANGLPSLAVAGDATAKAQEHSDEMAAAASLFHSSDLASGIQPGWSMLGENVGVGSSAAQLESMFEASSAHRDNLLNWAYNQVGVGVTRGGDGRLYVTQFFVAR
jgi:uncharacterized protein YkwD